MKSTITYPQQSELRIIAESTFQELLKSKQANDMAAFNQQVVQLMPELKHYIDKQLATAIKKGHFTKSKYKAADIIDQLFIEIYDHIDEVSHENSFISWLYKKTNELLNDIIVEEEFDDLFFKNIDDYSAPEWDAMEEEYSTDGDGDFVLIEDLDDRSYNHNDYTLNHVFVEDDEKELIEKIDADLSAKQIKKHIDFVLHNLPLAMRTVFELSVVKQLDAVEVAEIRNSTVDEVKKLLKDAQKALQTSFLNRFAVS
jgi:RNA polymerase sigma factor (sigma-70 family)